VAVAAVAAAALSGCGPAELTPGQASTLQSARERLDDAIDTEETCRTNRPECARLVRALRRHPNDPKRLARSVPSVVTPTGNVYPAAFNLFVRNATSDPKLALRLPAAREVERMVVTLDGMDADTEIETLENRHAAPYLEEAARDTKPIWPDLARVLGQARDEL